MDPGPAGGASSAPSLSHVLQLDLGEGKGVGERRGKRGREGKRKVKPPEQKFWLRFGLAVFP